MVEIEEEERMGFIKFATIARPLLSNKTKSYGDHNKLWLKCQKICVIQKHNNNKDIALITCKRNLSNGDEW